MSPTRGPHPLRCPGLVFWALAILLAASSLACGDDDPATPLPTPSAMEIVAGNAQVARASQDVPEPLVVRVFDDDSGEPVAGVTVVWMAQGGGRVDPGTVETNSEGLATAIRVLGPSAGEQTTTAAVGGVDGLLVTFTTTAEEYVFPRIPTTPSEAKPSHRPAAGAVR